MTRVETYPFLKDAVREALYNALVHSRWSAGIPIQIRTEDNAIYIKAERSALNSALKMKVLELLEKTPALTQKEMQEMLNETRSHIQIAIKELVSEGVIELKSEKSFDFGKYTDRLFKESIS